MEHPAFADAGQEPGVEIWTIDQFEPAPIERRMYGKFYNGDAYIVLKTTGDENSSFTYDAHFWLGANASQDKRGAAAILTVTLGDQLGGRAAQHREAQGHESSLFLGYFKPAIRYLEGGNESGFTEVETNAGVEKRLLRLSGCDNMRIEEVPAESSSLTTNHCFILEVDHDIFVLMPEGAKATQRRRIISVANDLRDDYHNGRASIEILDEFSSDDDFAAFFEALGSGSKDELLEEDSTDNYAREDMSAVYLYRVLLGDELDLISLSKPYKQTQLASDEVYILDTPCSGVYVWLGRGVDTEVKKNYNDVAQQYLDIKGYPSWAHVTRVAEGSEPCVFKQYFHNWDNVYTGSSVRSVASETDAGYFSGDAEEAAAAAKVIGKSAAARGFMPDDGDGTLTVTRVSGEAEDVTESVEGAPVLYQGDVYVLRYRYQDDSGEEACLVYVWVGADADADSKAAATALAAEIEEQEEGNVTVVRIPQGKETRHFLRIFKGNLAILFGSRESEYKSDNSRNSYDDDGIRLFRVEGTQPGVDMRAVQVEESAEVLEDDDVFVLETAAAIYVRTGKESDENEHDAAIAFLKLIVGDEKEVVEVQQGEEPDEFWEALGGAPEEKEDASGWRLAVNRRVAVPAALTAVSVSVTGRVRFEEMPPGFTQEDLSDDGVYVLDSGEELYVWQGSNVPERVRAARWRIVEEYIEDDGLERTAASAVVVALRQGREPAAFRRHFPAWDRGMWTNQASYEDIKNATKAANSK